MKLAGFLLVIIITAQAGDLLKRYQIIGAKKPSLVSILTQVEAQLQTGGSLDTILTYLDTLRSSIDQEQVRHDTLFTAQKTQCAAELELRTKDVRDADQVLNRATEQYENCSSSNKKAEAELDNNVENQKATDTDIKILDAIRNEGAQIFASKKQDHIDALQSLQESLKILDSFQAGGTSLVEMSEISMKLISDSVKLKQTHIMSTISGIFAQMLTQNGGYLEVFDKLKQMLTQLEQSLYKNLQKMSEEEDNAIQEYDDRRVHLVEYFNNLKKTEDKLRDHTENMEICQDQQSAIIESAKGKKIRNTELYDSADVMCEDFHQEYEKASAVRRQELDLVAQVKEQIAEKAAQRGF